MPVKITSLTHANVSALTKVFDGDDRVSLTPTTATFEMSATDALDLVTVAQDAAGKGTVRHSLHAVRRKLHRAVNAS